MVKNSFNTGFVNNTYNITVNNGPSLQSVFQRPLPPETTDLFRPNSLLSNFVSGFEAGFANGLGYGVGQAAGQAAAQQLLGQTAPVSPPAPVDSSHPTGSLTVNDKGVITTPGGYQIEATGQFEWTVTGKDGSKTRVWGDPHVEEKDGGKWDFKRASTFVLADGTKINCSVKPWGDGSMTVTSGLEIISGNDRVVVSDIDQGKGKVGTVTHDGFAHANSFGNNDVFVMGQDADDWSFQGKEIIGSNNGGESFQLGKDLRPLVDTTTKYGGAENYGKQLMADVLGLLGSMLQMVGQQMSQNGVSSPLLPQNTSKGNGLWEGTGNAPVYNPNAHQNAVSSDIQALTEMLKLLTQIITLVGQVRRPGVTA